MTAPCISSNCSAYASQISACRVIGAMKDQPPSSDERSARLGELLTARPCQFAAYIRRMAHLFIWRRGLAASQIEPNDILNLVSAGLMKNNKLYMLNPAHEHFKRYVTIMIRNIVNRNLDSVGPFVEIDEAHDLPEIENADRRRIEETFKSMDSLGPRQRKQARLLRLFYGGMTVKEIASAMEVDRATVSTWLHGNIKRDAAGAYYKAGAFKIFAAIYTGAIFALRSAERPLWQVVNSRDFGPEDEEPSFARICKPLGISKPEVIARYVAGWKWVEFQWAKGGGDMPGAGSDKKNGGGGQDSPDQSPVQRVALGDHQGRLNFHLLLFFAEDGLDRDARRKIASHLLICSDCLAELRLIETEILPEMNRALDSPEVQAAVPDSVKKVGTAVSKTLIEGIGLAIGQAGRLIEIFGPPALSRQPLYGALGDEDRPPYSPESATSDLDAGATRRKEWLLPNVQARCSIQLEALGLDSNQIELSCAIEREAGSDVDAANVFLEVLRARSRSCFISGQLSYFQASPIILSPGSWIIRIEATGKQQNYTWETHLTLETMAS